MLESIKKRDLTISELFSYSFNLYKENIKPVLFIIILVYFPISILMSIVQRQVMPLLMQISSDEFNVTAFIQDGSFGRLGVYYAILMLISIMVEPLGVISIAVITKERILGKEVHYKQAILHAFGKAGAIFTAGIVYTLGIAAGMMLLFIPGIILSVFWCFYLYAIAVKEDSGLNALSVSMKLVSGKWWITFGIIIILGIILQALSYGLAFLFLAGSGIFFFEVLNSVLVYFFNALAIIVMTVLFINRDYVVNGYPTDENMLSKWKEGQADAEHNDEDTHEQ